MSDYGLQLSQLKWRQIESQLYDRMHEISSRTGMTGFSNMFASALEGQTALTTDADVVTEEDVSPEAGSATGSIDTLISAAAEEYGISEAVLRAVIGAESDFDPDALSRAGAMGLMQLMPGTAEGLGVTDPYDPAQNIDGGARYLLSQLIRFDGDLRLALAAYNCGPGGVASRGVTDLSDPNQLSLLPQETQNYLKNIESRLSDMGQEALFTANVFA